MNLRLLTLVSSLLLTTHVQANPRLIDDVLRAGGKAAESSKRVLVVERQVAKRAAKDQSDRVHRIAQQEAQRAAQRAHQIQIKNKTQTLSNRFESVRDPHVIYQRYNPTTGQYYVGRAKSYSRFTQRQTEHNRARGTNHRFQVTATAPTTRSARVAEETSLRLHKNNPTTGARLENKRWEMGNGYHSSGGHVQRSSTTPRVTTPQSGHTGASASTAFNTAAR